MFKHSLGSTRRGSSASSMSAATRRRTRAVILTPAIIAAVAAGLVGCAPASGESDTGALRVGSAAESISFSPTSQDRLGVGMVYDYLLSQKDGVYSPRAAKSVEYNEGNTVLSIELRDGLTFSDGTPIDAEVIKADILWSKDNGAFFSSIEEVDVTGDLTLEIHQSHADHNVMLSLWAMPIVNVATTQEPESAATKPVESGPYLLDQAKTTTGASYVFERNPDYWDADNYPYDDVTVMMLPDDTSRINALKSGQVDVAPIAATTAAEAKGSGFTINELSAQFAGLILGDRRGDINPALADVRVRQAINMAFDREAVIQSVYAGYGTASSQPFAVGSTGYQKDQKDEYAYDPDGAKALLAEAGYPNGFELTIPTYAPSTRTVEPYLKQAMADIGITLVFDAQSDDTWLPAFSEGTYAAVPMTLPFAQSVDSAGVDFFWNGWHNDDPEAVALLDTINSGTPEEAAEATDALGKKELDEAWFAIYAHPSTIWASKSGIVVDQPQYADWVLISDIVPGK